ncbi:MAG: TetR/AcrR family transcriptional regulator [Desertimonas sp.]
MGTRRMTGPERAAQLLDVAELLFVEQGYETTTLEDIAQRAGVSRPVVYQHHGSKDGLYLACVTRARVGLVERSGQAMEGVTDPLVAMRAAADVWFAEVERDPRRWELLHTDSVARLNLAVDDVRPVMPSNAPFYEAALGRWARPDVEPRLIASAVEMIIGAGVGLAHWWIRNPEVSRQQVVDDLVQFCWQGLSALLPHLD